MTKKQNILSFVRPGLATWYHFSGTSPSCPQAQLLPTTDTQVCTEDKVSFSSPSDYMPLVCLWDLLNSHFQAHLLVQNLLPGRAGGAVLGLKKGPMGLEDIVTQPRTEAEPGPGADSASGCPVPAALGEEQRAGLARAGGCKKVDLEVDLHCCPATGESGCPDADWQALAALKQKHPGLERDRKGGTPQCIWGVQCGTGRKGGWA